MSANAWPEFQQVMRLALTAGRPEQAAGEERLSRWTSLPGLCCQAAGGDPAWTDDLTLAWLVFYAAAHLMDSVQDGDEPDAWWAEAGIGVALSAASGLYFSASQALNALHDNPATRARAIEISQRFNQAFLVMCSGQYADLTRPTPSLDEYWTHASAKSGAFFSLACWAGACLATGDADILAQYDRFGHHLGLLIQIKDDLDDVRSPLDAGLPGQKKSFARSLPVIYALQFTSPTYARMLSEYVRAAANDPHAAQEAIRILDESGAAVYVQIEMARQKALALAALDEAGVRSPAVETLANLVNNL